MSPHKRRVTGKTDDVALLIDRRRRVPTLRTEVTEVSHPAVFPKHGMLRRVSSNSLVANT